MEYITSKATYSLNGSVQNVYNYYSIRHYYKGDFSLMNLIDDLRAFSSSGFNNATRLFLSFIIIFAVVAYASSEDIGMGYKDPDGLLVLAWSLVWFFSYIGFLSVTGVNFPDIPGPDGWNSAEWLSQYAICTITTIIAGSYIIKRNL